MRRVVPAGVFKAECLKLMDEVNLKKQTIVITKRKKTIALLVPADSGVKKGPFGKMKGTIHIRGDIIKPIGEDWDACL